jgi:hypothetical protein
VTAAIEINDAKDASSAVEKIKKLLSSGKGSVLLLAIKIK